MANDQHDRYADGTTYVQTVLEPFVRLKNALKLNAKVYKRMAAYLGRYKLAICITIITASLVALLDVSGIALLAPVVDVVLKRDVSALQGYPGFDTELGQRIIQAVETFLLADPQRTLLLFAAAVAIVTILKNVLVVVSRYLSALIGFKITLDLRQDLFGRLIHAPLGFFSEKGVAAIITRILVDAGSVSTGVTLLFEEAVVKQFKMLGFVVLAFVLNWRWALFAFLGFPIIGYGLSKGLQRLKKYTHKSFDRSALQQSLLHELLYGIQIVKAFVKEDYGKNRFANEQRKLLRYFKKSTQVGVLLGPAMEVFGVTCVVLFVVLTGSQVLSGAVSPGRFFGFYGVLLMIYKPLRKTSQLFARMQVSIGAGERVFDFMDTPVEVLEKEDAKEIGQFRDKIELKDVRFSYNGEQEVLKDVEIARWSGREVGAALCRDTIMKTITFGNPEADEERVVWAARIANAHEFISKLPDGYNTVLGEGGMTLSGGERQRIAIARAALSEPQILILDEPTSSLDTESEEIVAEALSHAMEGVTTLVVSHRFSLVRRASRIVVMNDGCIEASGTHTELLERSPTYAKLFFDHTLHHEKETGQEAADHHRSGTE